MSLAKGLVAENLACDYLQRQGLMLHLSNYRSRMGEIDLIMQDGPYLVFVEVRGRASLVYGSALETVTVTKQRKIIKAAIYYLQSHQAMADYPCRFDVVTLQGQPPSIAWVKNAFSMH